MACGDKFRGLLVVDGSFGRTFTPENPCGLYCAIMDWMRWHGAVLKVRDLTRGKIVDLDTMQGVDADQLASLKSDIAAWEAAEQREPTLSGPRRALLDTKYGGDIKLALGATLELGEQSICLLERADDLVLASGGVSTTPQGKPGITPPRPKPMGGYDIGQIAAVLGIAWIGYQFVTRKRGDGEE